MNKYIDIVEDAKIFPAINDFKGYGRFIHGVKTKVETPIEYGLTRNGVEITKHDLRREFEENNSASKSLTKGKYLYCGPISVHFGHLLADCSSRLWACSEYQDECDGIIFLPDQKNYKLHRLHKEIFHLFKVDMKKALFIEKITEIKSLIVPHIGTSLGMTPKQWYKKKLLQLFGTQKLIDSSKPKKIVVSRKNFKYVGRVAGSDAINYYLLEDGYFEFFPEKFSLKEQLSYILSAEMIVWEEGSALHLLEILPEIQAKSIMIRRRPDYDEFDTLLISRSPPGAVVYNSVEYLELDVAPHNRMSRLCNIDELILALVTNGFLSSQPQNIYNFLSSESFDINTSYHKEIKSLLKNKI